ncbi:MAG: transporter ATP-binding protein [Gammaproteobacteria bacterium]|jgi:ATP-binding cassette subfamily F protein 3|nr:transporter ATP-binding protein [Gammaproteobacteria bacterium]
MITLQNISLRLGQKTLFNQANITLFAKERIGLIGANGSGKSTLFNLLLGQMTTDAGEVSIQPNLSIAHVRQEMPLTDATAVEYVLAGDADLMQIETAIIEAEKAQTYERLAELHTRLGDIDGYTANARASRLLVGLGFSQAELTQPVSAFSGGWRIRLNLAQALMCRSDLLLLDEPTNHLDLDAIIWLEKWLQQYQGTLILISHDREFLDSIVNRIVHVENQQLFSYGGNYTQFEKIRALKLAQQQVAYEKQQKKVAHTMDFVNRFRAKASKAKQAQSRLKSLAKMEIVSAVAVESPFQFEFRPVPNCPNPLLTVEDVSAGYGNRTVLKSFCWGLAPKERIGLLGPNGAGKSTFIKLLAGELKPQAGTFLLANGVKVGYYAQHQLEYLQADKSPLDHLQVIDNKATPQMLRNFLGGFGFAGEMATAKVAPFSGGEKARVALALLVWAKPQILLLDEPTNHLDMAMRNALSLALQDFEGAMILCSHDRYLLSSAVDDFLLIYQGEVRRFDGDVEAYYQWMAKQHIVKPENTPVKLPADADGKTPDQIRQELQKEQSLLEKKLEKLTREMELIETRLSALYQAGLQSGDESKKLTESLTQVKNAREKAESDWLYAQGLADGL